MSQFERHAKTIAVHAVSLSTSRPQREALQLELSSVTVEGTPEEDTFDVDRRAKRLSPFGRRVLKHVLATETELKNIGYFVFASRLGELEYIEENNRKNALGEVLSPSNFAYSIHNAVAGQLSILTHLASPSTVLCASRGIAFSAILDACAYISCTTTLRSAFVALYEAEAPARFHDSHRGRMTGYALSFALSVGGPGPVSAYQLSQALTQDDDPERELRLISQRFAALGQLKVVEWS